MWTCGPDASITVGASEADAHLGPAEVPLGLLQGEGGGITPGDPAQQVMHPGGVAESLEVAHKGQGTIRLLPPSQDQLPGHRDLQVHRFPFPCESRHNPAPAGLESQRLQTGRQQRGVAENGWQDGEMGHGPDARFS